MRPLLETPGYNRDRAIRCLVYDAATKHHTLDDLEAISEILRHSDGFVWLDLAQPTSDDLSILQREFGIHSQAVENVMEGDDRPKMEFFDDHVLVIAQATTMDDDGSIASHEVAIIAGRNYLITLRGFPVYPLAEIERRRDATTTIPNDATGLLYIILDTIVDDYVQITDRFDDRLVRLESKLFDSEGFDERTQREIFRLKRSMTLFRSMIVPMRDILLRLTRNEIAPLQTGLMIYYRDVYENVLHCIEQIDVTRELVNSTFDVHLATQSHKQNEVSKQLTIIATIFLPLTYITGFFGQNFGWMVNGITSPEIFWWLGIGSQVATLAILFWFFKSRRWI